MFRARRSSRISPMTALNSIVEQIPALFGWETAPAWPPASIPAQAAEAAPMRPAATMVVTAELRD
jgi:hypothetical protein